MKLGSMGSGMKGWDEGFDKASRRAAERTVEDLSELFRAALGRHDTRDGTLEEELGLIERPLYLCAAMTGLRQGELIGLRWCDVDWIAGRVRVAESYTRGAFDSPKSHRGRSVPMSDCLAGELERHFQRTRWRADRVDAAAPGATLHVEEVERRRRPVAERQKPAPVRRREGAVAA